MALSFWNFANDGWLATRTTEAKGACRDASVVAPTGMTPPCGPACYDLSNSAWLLETRLLWI